MKRNSFRICVITLSLLLVSWLPVHAQKRPLRADSLEVGGNDVTEFLKQFISANKLTSSGITAANILTAAILDSNITMAKLSTTVHAAMGGFGTGTYGPDDVTLEFDLPDSVLQIKSSSIGIAHLSAALRDSIFYRSFFDITDYGAIPGDGVCDIDSIQLAADAVKTNGGGVLIFPPGVWSFDSNTNGAVRIFSNTRVEMFSAKLDQISGGDRMMFVDGDSDIVFIGGEFDGNAEIDGIYNQFHHAISLIDGLRIKVDDVYIHNMGGDGVYFADTDYGTVINSTIIMTHLADSPFLGRNCIAVVEGENFIFEQNFLEGGNPAGVDMEPNAGLIVRVAKITDNIIEGGSYGINLYAEADAAAKTDSITVENNDILNVGDYGILVQGAQYWNLSGNDIKSSGRQGIFVLAGSNNGKIHNNDVYKSGLSSALGAGIELQDSLKNIAITNNRSSYNRRDGIKIIGTSGNENKNITVRGNDVWNNDRLDTSLEVGIRVWYCDSSYVDGNFAFDDQATATQLQGFNIANCDYLFFGSSNWGWGNTQRLFGISSLTKERIGQSAAYTWIIDNIAQGSGNQAMKLSGGAIFEVTVPFDCQIIGMSIATSDTVDTESYTITIFKNDASTGFADVVSAGGDVRYAFRTLLEDSDSDLLLVAGDRIKVIYSTHASLAPNGSLDVSVTVLVKY